MELPKVIRIEPAGSCNLKCIHCPTGQGIVGSVGVMRWSTFEEVVKRITPHAPYNAIVLYHGGEPFLNVHFADMVKSVRPLCKKIKTVSNGMLITRDKARAAIQGGLDEITISIDGSSAEENDSIRLGAKFGKLVGTVRLLAEEAKGTNTQIIVSNSDASVFARDFMRKEFAGLPSSVLLRQNRFIIWPAQLVGSRQNRFLNNRCDKIEETITIRWNGDVVPCCYDLASQSVMGNIMNSSLEDIWNGVVYTEFRKKIAEKDPPNMCRSCIVLTAPAHAYREEVV